jgi:uncharacterized membrane protein
VQKQVAILYYRKNDFEINTLQISISEVCKRFNLELASIDIERIENSGENHSQITPSLKVGPYLLKYPFTLIDVEIAVSAFVSKNQTENKNNIKGIKVKNSIGIFLAKKYPLLIAALLMLFVGGSVLAPVLASYGKTKAANSLYHFYSFFCHQLAFRSFFIFGEQNAYPRELANIRELTTYEEQFNDPFLDVENARKIIGDNKSGYKIALCERDLAIYSALGMSALAFQALKKKVKPIPWYWWFIFALIPIAIDGFSQLPGISSGWPVWLPRRESTPFLRVLTGTLFGGVTGLYMLPLMEDSLKETRYMLLRQKEIIKATSTQDDKTPDKRN